MKEDNIILIGMPGCGKTTVGKKLEKLTEFEFIDLDLLIENRENRPITLIFKDKGEKYFRKLETKILCELKGKKRKIISTGGGIAESEENFPLVKELGKVFYLEIPPDEIFNRIKEDKTRPLLLTDDPKKTLEELFKRRENKYLKMAQYKINANQSADLAAEGIIKLYEKN